jgi:hypothetical protein
VKRITGLVLALPLILAAQPASRDALPIPPIPPDQQQVDGPAPTPDRDAAPPSAPPSEGARIVPRVVRVPTYANDFDRSQGYLNGSRQQQEPSDRRVAPSPGFNLLIPFK